MTRWGLVLVAAAACGRIGFDPTSSDPPLPDAPPLPALACESSIVRLPIEATPNSQLAAKAIGTSYLVLWAAPGEPVKAAQLMDGQFAHDPVELATGPVDSVTGIFVTPTTILFATTKGNTTTVRSLMPPGTIASTATDTRISGRAPIIANDTNSLRAWVRVDPTGVVAAYLDDDGVAQPDRISPTTTAVVSIAGANNTDHTHLTWAEQGNSGTVECHQADLGLVPVSPQITGSDIVDADCRNPRIDSGRGAADSIMTVYETSTGAVRFRHLGGGGATNNNGVLAAAGRAPKVAFDGTRMWAAWLETDGLHLAAIDHDTGVTDAVAVPGWNVVGDEAFQLVRAGNAVDLVLLDRTTISVLRTCMP